MGRSVVSLPDDDERMKLRQWPSWLCGDSILVQLLIGFVCMLLVAAFFWIVFRDFF